MFRRMLFKFRYGMSKGQVIREKIKTKRADRANRKEAKRILKEEANRKREKEKENDLKKISPSSD